MHRPCASRRRGASRARAASALVLALALGAGAGCSKKGPAVVKNAERPATDDDIDREPLALLPAGAVLVGRLDAHALSSSSLGPKAQRAFEAVAPIAPAAGFAADRDLESVVAAAYSVQGADVAVVARGSFEPAAFDRAVEKGALGPYGTPWVKGEHAGRTVYSSADVSFAPLTKKTALAGSSTGVRRSLDRLRFGAPKVELPAWASDVVAGSAPFALAGEWGDQPLAAEIVARAPFLSGVRAARLSGNFGPPGVNADGQLSYPSAEAAADAEGRIRSLGQLASIASIIGLSPIHDFRSDVKGERMHVTVAVDGPYLARWLEVVPQMVPMLVPRPANPG
ncbi:MAG TPA: hypothetical protein VFS43_44960 [Polyangiaceae bacterium]|nr:hypothetical protein [Polyangiaceae bacterium]